MAVAVPLVPLTGLATYFLELPTSRAERLSEAHQPGLVAKLADLFADSVDAFSSYDSLHPFHTEPPSVVRGAMCTRDEHVAARLASGGPGAWEVPSNTDLNFVYLDREIVPTAGVAKGFRIDLLLGNATDFQPILCEVKIATDKDMFFALVQALVTASQLVTRRQLGRLCLWGSGPEFIVRNKGTVDLYLMWINPVAATFLPQLEAEAHRLARQLLKQPSITQCIRRIEFIRGTCTDKTLLFD